MANSDLVSIDPLRLSTLSFIIHLRLMGTDGGPERMGMNCVLVCFHKQSEMFSCDGTDSNEPHGGCVSASLGLSVPGLIRQV